MPEIPNNNKTPTKKSAFPFSKPKTILVGTSLAQSYENGNLTRPAESTPEILFVNKESPENFEKNVSTPLDTKKETPFVNTDLKESNMFILPNKPEVKQKTQPSQLELGKDIQQSQLNETTSPIVEKANSTVKHLPSFPGFPNLPWYIGGTLLTLTTNPENFDLYFKLLFHAIKSTPERTLDEVLKTEWDKLANDASHKEREIKNLKNKILPEIADSETLIL